MKRILLILVLASPAWVTPVRAANDFSGDPNCVALWRFESGALTTDTIGSNTLSQTGSPDANTVNYKEGAAACDFEASDVPHDFFSIADASLDAGFPFKSGDTSPQFTICYWVRPEVVNASQIIWMKGRFDDATISCFVTHLNTAQIKFCPSANGTSYATVYASSETLVAGQWFHVAITYNDSTGAIHFRIWDETAGTTDNDDAVWPSGPMHVDNGIMYIGTGNLSGSSLINYNDCILDEMVIFNDILTDDEIDAIRGGTYSLGDSTISSWWWRRRHSD